MTDTRAPRNANIFDVARLAGVSHQTVSRVINNHPSVKPATRARVQEAIRQLRYRPSQAARSLVTKRSRTIGLIMPATADFGPTTLAIGVNAAARDARYAVVGVNLPDVQAASVRTAIEAMLRQNVEAIVVIADDIAVAEFARGTDAATPVVVVAAGGRPHSLTLSIDQYAGARLATRHLLGLGFETVVHIAGPARNPDAAERVRGWMAELRQADAPPGLRLDGDWSPGSGHAAGMRLAVVPGATAVFAANDQTALGLIAALSSRGFRVPDDVSVVGFDDIPEAAFMAPPLTTLRQDFTRLGQQTMERVLTTLESPTPLPPADPIATKLIIRQSTRPRTD
ncbi:LacI family DNA-binding transcriptional regulator [Microbacterium terrisoli]|uniref:LacI family DNA-binding transcriptional regulator n=1 Tax=Microbacterium terrisoli TaxID=3242192 RepID=UPI0028043DE2|nr:LacI family DNA-binding transcriptional regulator [Microbacterium protaetiae]